MMSPSTHVRVRYVPVGASLALLPRMKSRTGDVDAPVDVPGSSAVFWAVVRLVHWNVAPAVPFHVTILRGTPVLAFSVWSFVLAPPDQLSTWETRPAADRS